MSSKLKFPGSLYLLLKIVIPSEVSNMGVTYVLVSSV
jgi:hypothetical protein